MRIKLHRVHQSDKGTFGALVGNAPLCVTLEDPWNNNKRGISCIPAGVYKCVPHNGTKFKDVWILEDVPGRSAILIHAGNSIADTSGCILVGRSFNAHTIASSRNALDFLRAVLPDRFEIEIIDSFAPRAFNEPKKTANRLKLPAWLNSFSSGGNYNA